MIRTAFVCAALVAASSSYALPRSSGFHMPRSTSFRSSAPVYHSGYIRRSGTYVQPHYQSGNDGLRLNNYSTKGNANPFTGKPGTVDPYKPYGK